MLFFSTYLLLLTTALPQTSQMTWSNHLSRLRNMKNHTWLRNFHLMKSYNKLTHAAKLVNNLILDGSVRNNNLEAQTKNGRYNNDRIGYISHIHLRNGSINTPLTFLHKCLCAHNYKRRLHDAPKLKWSAKLAEEAQNQADQLASMGISAESEIANKEENIYVDYIVDLSTSCSRAVEFWYAESKNYNNTQNEFSKDTEHFTRLLWQSSSQLGVGRAISKSGKVIVVAKYQPKGNIKGKFKTNVRQNISSTQDDNSNLEPTCSSVKIMNKKGWPISKAIFPTRHPKPTSQPQRNVASTIHGDLSHPPGIAGNFQKVPPRLPGNFIDLPGNQDNLKNPTGSLSNSRKLPGSPDKFGGPPGNSGGPSGSSGGPPGSPSGSPGGPPGSAGAPSGSSGGPSGSPGGPPGSPGAPARSPGAPSGSSGGPPGSSGAPPGSPGGPPRSSGAPPGSPGAPSGSPGGPPGSSGAPPGSPGAPPGSLGVPPVSPGAPSGSSGKAGGFFGSPGGLPSTPGGQSSSLGFEKPSGNPDNSVGPTESPGNSPSPPGGPDNYAGLPGNAGGPSGSSGNFEGHLEGSGNTRGPPGSSDNTEGPPGSSGNSKGPPASSSNLESPARSSGNVETPAGGFGNNGGSPGISEGAVGRPNNSGNPLSGSKNSTGPSGKGNPGNLVSNKTVEVKTNSTKQLGIPDFQHTPISYLPQAQTVPDILGRTFNVTIVLPQQPFEADLLRTNSLIFHQLKSALEQAIRNLYADNSFFMDVQVIEFRAIKALASRSIIPKTKMYNSRDELVTVVVVSLNFNPVMQGHLSLLGLQLDSGVLGSVAVGRNLYAARTDKDSCMPSCKKPYTCFPACAVICCLP